MIYKILLIAVSAAAVVGFKLSGDYAKEAQEAAQAQKASLAELTDAQKREADSLKVLQEAIDAHGDYTKKDFLELEKMVNEKNAEYINACAENQEICNQLKSAQLQEKQVNNDIASLESDISRLEKEIDQNINRVIAATMNLVRPEGSTREALAELFDETVVELNGHKSLNIDDLCEEAQRLNQRYALRAHKFKGAGVNKTLGRLCIILGYTNHMPRVKAPYIKNETGYIMIVYQFGDSGRVNARGIDYMSIEDKDFVDSLLPEGHDKFSYKGDDYDRFFYKGATEVKSYDK